MLIAAIGDTHFRVDNISIVDILIEEMQWQEHPTIASVDVPMKANMEIGPDWATQVKLPNQATETEIQNILIGL